MRRVNLKVCTGVIAALLVAFASGSSAYARDVEYQGGEVSVYVNPNEPTQVKFPGPISGGFKKRISTLSLDRRENDLFVFANERLSENGEAIIVRLEDGRSFSLRVLRAGDQYVRDDVVRVLEKKDGIIVNDEEDGLPPSEDRKFDYAPPTQISGLMRELVLVTEFGKRNISGYRATDVYRGQTVLNDGTMLATVETIFIGPNLWGYVISARNLLDQTQRLNPATFRIDGTRAISAKNWELAPRPLDIEQQIAGKHETKIYVVTRAK